MENYDVIVIGNGVGGHAALQASPGDERIELTWDATSDDSESEITEYRIYRGTSSGDLS